MLQAKILLKPFAYLYSLGVRLRNWMFDRNILKGKQFSIPIVCVGNLLVGGTGKTPHVEKLIAYFMQKRRVAVVSRGYKRKTKGMIVVGTEHTPREVGDEPCQIKHKFPSITVIVSESRTKAIRFLEQRPIDERPEIILMDDGFQHRYVKPTCSILLFPYGKDVEKEPFLPMGKMRESFEERSRADIVIVSKCPQDLNPIDFTMAEKKLDLFANQFCFFTRVYFDYPIPLVSVQEHVVNQQKQNTYLLPVASIAQPDHFVKMLKSVGSVLQCVQFSDHHHFSRKDIQKIYQAYKAAKNKYKDSLIVIVTTEKDAMRMREVISYFPQGLLPAICYFPLKVSVCNEREERFFSTLESVVFNRKNFIN